MRRHCRHGLSGRPTCLRGCRPTASIVSAIPREPSHRMLSPAPYRGRRVRTSRRDFSHSFFLSTCNCWTSVNVDGEKRVPCGSWFRGASPEPSRLCRPRRAATCRSTTPRNSGRTKGSVVLEHDPVDWGGLRFSANHAEAFEPVPDCTDRRLCEGIDVRSLQARGSSFRCRTKWRQVRSWSSSPPIGRRSRCSIVSWRTAVSRRSSGSVRIGRQPPQSPRRGSERWPGGDPVSCASDRSAARLEGSRRRRSVSGEVAARIRPGPASA